MATVGSRHFCHFSNSSQCSHSSAIIRSSSRSSGRKGGILKFSPTATTGRNPHERATRPNRVSTWQLRQGLCPRRRLLARWRIAVIKMAPSRGVQIRAFIRDWIIFAPIPVTIALIISAITRTNIVNSELSNGALLSYSIALCWAFLDDIPTDKWDEASPLQRKLSQILPAYKLTLTVLVMILACILAVSRALEASKILGDKSDSVRGFLGTPGMFLTVSALLAAVTLLASILALRERLRTELNGG